MVNTRMMRILVFLVLCVGATAKKRYDGHRMVLTVPKTSDDLQVLVTMQEDRLFEEILHSLIYYKLDFWTEPSRVRPTTVRVSPNDFERFHSKLQEAGIQYNVTVENIQLGIDQEEMSMKQSRRTAKNICDFFQTYCTLAEVNEIIDMIQTEFPNRVEVDSIGKSRDGRDIRRVRIAEDLNSFDKPAIYLESATHAREWITVSAALYMIRSLARGNSEMEVFMLSKFDWYVIAVHNPDGYEFSHTNERLWRKNRQVCNGRKNGVDLNRNYNASFGGLGTSNVCTSNVYRGPSAFSENETTALRDAIMYTPNVFAFFAIHSYGEMLLVPFAYDEVYPARYQELEDVAKAMTDEIFSYGGPRYQVGTAWSLLYPAAGGSDDYFYFLGVPYSYTYELSPDLYTSNGFILDTTYIRWVMEDLFVSLWKFASLPLDWPTEPNEPFP